MKSLLKIAVCLVVFFTAACMHGPRNAQEERIIDATASMVLDGGSYNVTLIFAPDKHTLLLFVANPTRRWRNAPDQSVWLEDPKNPKGGQDQALLQDSPLAKRLRQQLKAAQSDPQVDPETKTICRMLERLLINPTMPYDDVHFPEKWNLPGT